MQGQSSTSEPFCEPFEFEHGSSSSNLGLDQLGFENNGSHNPLESQTLSPYTLSSGTSSMPNGSVASLQSNSVISWISVGPSSSLHAGNQNNHSEIKLPNDWTSVASSSGGRQGPQESHCETTKMLSSENLNIDLNINHIDNVPSFSQVSDFSSIGCVAPIIGVGSQVSGSGLYSQPPIPGLLQPQLASSSSGFTGSHGSSSRANNFHDNGGSQQGLLLGGRCSLHKRKGIELVPGQSSTSGSSSNPNQGLSIPREDLSTRLGIATRFVASDSHSFCNTVGNQEGFLRNSRLRTNQSLPSDSSLSNNYVNHTNNWSVHQSSPVPSNQLLETRLLGSHTNPHSQPNVSSIPSLPTNTSTIVRSGVSTSRVGSRSNPAPITADVNAIDEPNLRNFQRNNFIDPSVIYPSINNGDMEQDPIDGVLNNGTTVVPGHALNASWTRSVFAAYQPPGNSGISLQQRRDNFRRSLYPSTSEPRGQNVNPTPYSGHFPPPPPEVGRVPARIHLPSFMTVPPIAPERQNEGAPPIPQTVRHRRNPEMYMADLLRRMDHSFFEDVLLFERSMLLGAAEFHDRHRDMRLDVDNMSYEELLALEERIGNVNTGLDEEKIKKCLKQRIYVPIASESSSQVEPCCICQEEYVEGEHLGRLECGHDFHSACIKKWLVIKNMCPICKNSALKS